MSTTTKRCSTCKKNKDVVNFGFKKNNEEYKTCTLCRTKRSKTTPSSGRPSVSECVNPSNDKVNDKLVWKKGFLNNVPTEPPTKNVDVYDGICLTLTKYGYTIYTKDDVNLTYFNSYDFASISNILKNTKSIFIFKISYPITTDDYLYCTEVLNHTPTVTGEPYLIYISYSNEKSENVVKCLPIYDLFTGFVKTLKLKDQKRCNICQLRKKCYRSCSRCNDKYCVECYSNIHEKTMKACPYCRYNFTEHIYNNLDVWILTRTQNLL